RHGRLRRRELLPSGEQHARTDGGLHHEDVRPAVDDVLAPANTFRRSEEGELFDYRCGRWNARTRNAAICWFGIPVDGQKLFPPHPAVIPSRNSSPIQSPNGAWGVGGHGTSSKTAVCARVWIAFGQKFPPPQPTVYPSSKNDWM